ncbi:MAG: LLM class flavin-dependent oxidoreductase [Candidatus Hodarchaeales archaeon]
MVTKKSLGFILSFDYISPSMCLDLLPFIEETAFTHIFVPELWGHDAFTQIAIMSEKSSKLIFGTGIVNLYSRSPATLAQTAASLFEHTNGRFILGLGLSGPIVVQNWHGYNYFKPTPLQRTREYFDILRLIFSGERVNYAGKIFSLNNFKLKSFQVPLDIPLFLAALGPKNVQLAGELADGWFPIWTPFSQINTLLKNLKQGLDKRSSTLSQNVNVAPFIITCASDSEKAKLLVKKHIAYYIGGMGDFYNNFMKRLGFEREARNIMEAWKANDRQLAAQYVSDSMIREVVVLGKPEYVEKRFKEIRNMGINLPVVMLPYNCPTELAIETIGVFSNF